MNIRKNTRVRFRFADKAYVVSVNSIDYEGTLIVSKLIIGHVRLWLIMQNGVWRFIADMPLCDQLKSTIIQKISRLHGIQAQPVCAGQMPLRSGILLNAVLSVMAVNRKLS